jgi:hypothetical protein
MVAMGKFWVRLKQEVSGYWAKEGLCHGFLRCNG